jgi:hypothetical protein
MLGRNFAQTGQSFLYTPADFALCSKSRQRQLQTFEVSARDAVLTCR